ncbi:hypothetical protein [Sutcliffiella halmapala]|uniref:hypothetical protein n=1 Tax=Sutcliffiella halmapala TaxID=79882 RepID=UPI0011170D0F|nr:hypothetical protein [Sutcliffiella halmapala]
MNWFGVSYILFALYDMAVGLLVMKGNALYKLSLFSVFFWLLFLTSVFTILIPFVKEENPF